MKDGEDFPDLAYPSSVFISKDPTGFKIIEINEKVKIKLRMLFIFIEFERKGFKWGNKYRRILKFCGEI